MNNKMRLISQS